MNHPGTSPSAAGAPRPGSMIAGLWFLAPREALTVLQEGALLVDLRSEELAGMKTFGVPAQIRIPHRDLPRRLGELPRDRLLVLADASGVYLRGAAAALGAAGFGQVACLIGGILAWDQADLPVITDPGALLHGDCACVMRSRK